MKKTIIFLTLFFFLASFGQLIYLQIAIDTAPPVSIAQPLSLLQTTDKMTLEERQNTAKLETIILLETNTMERRHHEASVLLMSGIWVKYLGFVTGMILAMIGAIFILGKLEQSDSSEITGKTVQGEISIKSASPGIILVVLGAILMIITIVMQDSIQVNDAAVYLQTNGNSSILTAPVGKPILTLPKNTDSKIIKDTTIPNEHTSQKKPLLIMPK